MAYTLRIQQSILENNENFKNENGNHECVILVQQAAGAPNTSNWRKGIKVLDASLGAIVTGTAIATFNSNGRYPATARHAAIYISHDKDGIKVYDQWNRQGKVKQRTISKKKFSVRNVNDANYYYVID